MFYLHSIIVYKTVEPNASSMDQWRTKLVNSERIFLSGDQSMLLGPGCELEGTFKYIK